MNLFCKPVGLCISGSCRTHSFGISSTKLEMNPMALRNQRLRMWNSQENCPVLCWNGLPINTLQNWGSSFVPGKLAQHAAARDANFVENLLDFFPRSKAVESCGTQYPIGSMYGIYGNMDPIFYHHYTPNVSIYSIHGSYGVWLRSIWWFSFSWQFFSFRHWWLRSRAADPSTNLELFGAVLVYMYNYVPFGKLT